jgi:hypothetical protein
MKLKGKVVYIDRDDVNPPKGGTFWPTSSGYKFVWPIPARFLGTLVDVLTPPALRSMWSKAAKRYLIPAVDEFLVETNVTKGISQCAFLRAWRNKHVPIDIMTLFDATVGDMMNESILGRAQERDLIRIRGPPDS